MKTIPEEQHTKALTCAQLRELLADHPESVPCIITSSDTLFSIKKVEQTTAQSHLTHKDHPVLILRI